MATTISKKPITRKKDLKNESQKKVELIEKFIQKNPKIQPI